MNLKSGIRAWTNVLKIFKLQKEAFKGSLLIYQRNKQTIKKRSLIEQSIKKKRNPTIQRSFLSIAIQ
jgi:hypothetical protein